MCRYQGGGCREGGVSGAAKAIYNEETVVARSLLVMSRARIGWTLLIALGVIMAVFGSLALT